MTLILDVYFLPFISKNIDNKGMMKHYLYVKRPKIMLAGTLAIILIFLAIPFIFNFIYGNTYNGSVITLIVLLIGLFFRFYSAFYIPLFNSLNKYKFMQIVNTMQIVFNLALDFLLVPLFGIVGAAIATTLSYILRFIVNEIYYRTQIRKNII